MLPPGAGAFARFRRLAQRPGQRLARPCGNWTRQSPAIAALEIAPQYAEIHNNLANSLKGQGKIEEAIALYRRAIEMKPDYAEAHNNLSTAFTGAGPHRGSGRLLPPALEIRPDYPEALNNLGVALKDQKQTGRGDRLLSPGVGVEARLRPGPQQPGRGAARPGQARRGGACYRRALELNPNSPKVTTTWATRCWRCGGWRRRLLATGGPCSWTRMLPRSTAIWATPSRSREGSTRPSPASGARSN